MRHHRLLPLQLLFLALLASLEKPELGNFHSTPLVLSLCTDPTPMTHTSRENTAQSMFRLFVLVPTTFLGSVCIGVGVQRKLKIFQKDAHNLAA